MTSTTDSLTSLNEILSALCAYETEHPAEGPDYDPKGIWEDVIIPLAEYDADATSKFPDLDRFALKNGTIVFYDPAGPIPWRAELSPGDDIPPVQNVGRPGFKVGHCGHAVAGSEWRAGYRNCEHCGESGTTPAAPVSDSRMAEIVAQVNAYEAERPGATVSDVWQDVIIPLPEYDDGETDPDDDDRLVLTDGTEIYYDRRTRTWAVDRRPDQS
jgi:hypothetical protein